jgi:MFS transporter, PPP family, 3-phenylpropionic acid transporter
MDSADGRCCRIVFSFKIPYDPLMESNTRIKMIISSQYFLYFGLLGVFLPYFNLYCYHLEFTGFQIGLLSSIRSVMLVLFPLLWGSLADRFQLRRPIYIFCCFTSTIAWAFYLYHQEFWMMFVITIFYGIFSSPLISFLEATTIESLGKEKKQYGKIRAWGSFSFIMTVIVMGRIIDLSSVQIIILCILIGSTLMSLFSTAIPGVAPQKKSIFISQAKHLLTRKVFIFLICAFLMLVSHGAYYGFFSIHLEKLGYDSTFIGFSWALASTAEIFVMIKSESIFKRFSMEKVLVFSFFIAVLRWLTLYTATSTAIILLSQLSHAVTYGTFHMASILYIDQLAPKETKTLAQAANNALTYGLGLMVGFFLSGILFEPLGTYNLFLLSAGVAALAGILFKVGGWVEGRRD